MKRWEYLVIIYEAGSSPGWSFGSVRYPKNFDGQDVNQILNILGQAGWEIESSHTSGDARGIITLTHELSLPETLDTGGAPGGAA